MNVDALPIPVVFLASLLFVFGAIELGFRWGRAAHRSQAGEKESPVSAIGGTLLGLTGFILAFAFGSATDRFDMRRALVRDEAGAIRTTYLRADFLPDSASREAKTLLKAYVVQRVTAVRGQDPEVLARARQEAVSIQRRLWEGAIANGRSDVKSEVGALYVEALNEMINLHAARIDVVYEARIPAGAWVVMYLLTGLGMLALGFHAGIAGSGRSWTSPMLALAFSLVLMLLVTLDRPKGTFIRVSQQPLVDVRDWMDEGGGR